MNNYGCWARDSRWIVFQSDRHASPFTDTLALSLISWIVSRST